MECTAQPQTEQRSTLAIILSFYKTVIFLAAPVLLAVVPLYVPTSVGLGAYVALLLAVYWVFEVVPLAVTALLPIILFPILGIVDSKRVCSNYFKDTNVLFVGGLIVAVAVEKWNLHKRIALRVLMMVGSKPRWIMFGFMLTTAFLSMWISNTATTAMMVPVAQAVVSQLCHHGEKIEVTRRRSIRMGSSKRKKSSVTQTISKTSIKGITTPSQDAEERNPMLQSQNGDMAPADSGEVEMGQIRVKTPDGEVTYVVKNDPVSKESEILPIEEECEDIDDNFRQRQKKIDLNLQKGIFLCVAYAANIGGTGTLTGTNPNLVLAGQVDSIYGREAGINFGTWCGYAFPGMVLTLFICWVLLDFMFLDLRNELKLFAKNPSVYLRREEKHVDDAVKSIFYDQYQALGPTSWAEIAVLCHFTFLALLWLTRDPGFIPGWSDLFTEGYVTDATAAVMIAVSLFVFPSRKPNLNCCGEGTAGPVPAVLDWKSVNNHLPWSVVILLGGSFALADGIKVSGLTDVIGEQLTGLQSVPPFAVALVSTIVVAIFTEITSNTATATIFLPVLGKLAEALHLNPLYLMLPATLTCSFAFILPIATPPNAIAFSYGVLTVADMVKAGTPMTIIAIFIALLNTNLMGVALFGVNNFPDWAITTSATAPVNTTANIAITCFNISTIPPSVVLLT
ncbi:Na(+)/citrate cotransporter-like [Saccoglossus kowalevskii]